MHVIIDGDVLKYRCGFAAQKSVWVVYDSAAQQPLEEYAKKSKAEDALHESEGKNWRDFYSIEERIIPEPLDHALYTVKRQIEQIIDKTQADEQTIILSGPTNFREDIATIKPYKGNRPDRKPFHYDAIHKYLMKQWPGRVAMDMEGDDLMSILQWQQLDVTCDKAGQVTNVSQPKKHRTCIATIDKDLDMVPGWHYNILDPDEGVYWCDWSPGELLLHENEDKQGKKIYKIMGMGLKFFYAQLLVGDVSDNIQGCPRIGHQIAYNQLQGLTCEQDFHAQVYACYGVAKDKGLLPDGMTAANALLENGRLLWMCRTAGEAGQWKPFLPYEGEDE